MQLKPETERLVQEEISSGHFHLVDELIVQGVNAWREKHRVSQPAETPAEQRRPAGTKSLAQFLRNLRSKGCR